MSKNIDNYILEPLYHDLAKVSYIKQFTTIFSDDALRNFFLFALNKNDQTYEARKEYFENKMDEDLDAIDSFEKSKKRRKRKFQDID